MPCDKWQENVNSDNPGAEEPRFITKYQFAAIVKHFENILEELKLDEEQYKIRLEFKNLLDIFKSSYAENKRKTHKIFELKATRTVELSRIKSLNSEQDEVVKGLRDTINVLQRNLDAVNKQRKELFEELEGLRKGVETADKATETHDTAFDKPPALTRKKDYKIFQALVEGVLKAKKADEKPVDDQLPVKESVETQPTDVNDIKILKNDLDILVADLKMTREKVLDLKREVRQRDIVIKKYAENLAFSEEMVEESRKEVEEVRKPLEKSMTKYQEELERNKHKYNNIYKDLQASLELNKKLSKDVESKELDIKDLKAKLEVLVFERDANERKAKIYEEHLARSQGKIEILKQEIENLKYEVDRKKKEIIALEKIAGTIKPEKDKIAISAQERFVEKLKNQIMLREKKLLGVGNELQATVEILQSIKRDQEKCQKDKKFLEHEVGRLKDILEDRNEDLKQEKEKLKANAKEINNMKEELCSWVKKYQQSIEKKNKFQDLYNYTKLKKNELGKENMILGKRLQYLLKILKEKDKEIEKLLHWKKYNI